VLGIDKPTISKTADKLTEWGLVHRQENLEDRRLVELWPGKKETQA
jgi:DNA-binding MarR family transcriptional regulator